MVELNKERVIGGWFVGSFSHKVRHDGYNVRLTTCVVPDPVDADVNVATEGPYTFYYE